MPNYTVSTNDRVSESEVLTLYGDAGWGAYTKDPATLMRGIRNSSIVVAARGASGALIGLARAISDDATICYVQDILVRSDARRTGVGRALLTQIGTTYSNVRQTVLLTDDEPDQRAFYQSLGFTEASDFTPQPLRAFVRTQ